MAPEEPMYTVGVVVGTHGLRGEVRIFPRTDFPEVRFRQGSVLWLDGGTGPAMELRVERARKHKNVFIVQFAGFHSIQAVEPWKGRELKVPESALMPLPEGRYYIHQLVGCRVVDEHGRWLGELSEVLQPGANDVYVVRRPGAKDLLVPAIPSVVKRVSVEDRLMVVSLPEGLEEL
ncbi:MAG: ribosome maturation factor RimM [Kyrpidia tusciae]|nr:ribosome maturation factor RimM [Kyrpidia tusciae]MBE3552993.1 ribosome maturation factor RimM [Kyrpidia tusciae]